MCVKVGAFKDAGGCWVGDLSLRGEFLKREKQAGFLLFVTVVAGGVQQGDADIDLCRAADDSVVAGLVCGGSPEGRPGEDAWLFEVVPVSCKGGAEVFSDHEACFERVVGVGGFYELVDEVVGVLMWGDGDTLGVPAKVVSDGVLVGLYGGVDVSVLSVLWGEDDEEVWVCFKCWWLCCGGVLCGCGNEGELTDHEKNKDADYDPGSCVSVHSLHHPFFVILS